MGQHDPVVDAWFDRYDNPQRDLVMAVREAILDAALHLFTERTFAACPVPLVAERAGVATGTIYRYFPSKEALVNEVYRRWNKVLAEYDGDRMAVAEAWTDSAENTAAYVRADELQQAFNFHWLSAAWSAPAFRKVVNETLAAVGLVGASPTWVLSNHDVVRHPTRYGGGPQGLDRARAAVMTMMALPGSAYWM